MKRGHKVSKSGRPQGQPFLMLISPAGAGEGNGSASLPHSLYSRFVKRKTRPLFNFSPFQVIKLQKFFRKQPVGNGKGGRNQELALSAAAGIEGLDNVLIFSLGSDGTDGPTDAAGGIVDGTTAGILREHNLSIHQVLKDNDAYNALAIADGLIFTGPTGTNVNDVSVVLIR